MTRRYSLITKINALNEIDEHDGDLARVGELLEIPKRTLHRWLVDEADLRRSYRERQKRQRDRLTLDLQCEMLERGKSILARMDADSLSNAPLNQLATALGSLVNHSLKLDEVIEETDEAEEKVIRHEFYYDGQVQDSPPWAEDSDEASGALQGGRLRAALGQDRVGQNGASAQFGKGQETRLVAGPDLPDGGADLEGSEEQRERD